MASVLELILRSKKEGTGVKDTEKALGGLEKIAKKVGVAFVAMKVAKFAKDATLLAARVETLGVVTKKLGENVGMTERDVRSLEQAIVDQGITLQGSRQAIAMMVQANVDLAHATDLARLAQDTAVIANINSSEAFQQLTYVLQTGNVRMARTLGLNVQFGQAQQDLAKELGKTTAELSEQEIMQARTNAVMNAGTRIAGTYEAAMETAGKQILSMDRMIEEMARGFGEAFLPVLEEAVGLIYEASKATLSAWESANQLKDAQEYLNDAGIDWNKILKEQGIELAEGGYRTEEYTNAIIEMAEGLQRATARADELMLRLAGIQPIEIGIEGPTEEAKEELFQDFEDTANEVRRIIHEINVGQRREWEAMMETAGPMGRPADMLSKGVEKEMIDAGIAAEQVAIAAGDTSMWQAAHDLVGEYGDILDDSKNTAQKMYNHLQDIANMSPIEVEVVTTDTAIPRQHGGPVQAGRPYIVGEREAELFVPNQSGHIYNQNQLAGGDVNIHNGLSQRAFDNMAENFFRGLSG